MQKLFKKKMPGVTLLELMIVMVIIGILSVILFRTFGTASELAFRIEQEKNVIQEVLTFSQILQNYADRNKIDYDKYSQLSASNGLTNVLYLSGQDGQLAIYSSGNCLNEGEVMTGALSGDCSAYLGKNGEVIQLTNPNRIRMSKIMFKVIPFASQDQYINMTGLCDQNSLVYCLNNPGFRVLAQAYNPRYSASRWGNNVKMSVQQFFSIK